LALVVVVLVLILIFWNSPESEAPTGETPTSQVPAPGFEGTPEMIVEASENEIIFTDAGFLPAELRVKAGDTVTFENRSSVGFWPASAIHPTHEVYAGTSLSEHCPDGGADAFDACGAFAAGSSWSFTFTKSGTWKYHDHLNASRTGTIVVE
jgi:plastocyanin